MLEEEDFDQASAEAEIDLSFLSEEERSHFIKHATKLSENHSPWYLMMHGTPWSVDRDILVYIDERGVDTAHGHGADEVLERHLDEGEIEQLYANGYISKDTHLFAFGRFLMERFIYGVLAQKKAKADHEDFVAFLEDITKKQEMDHEESEAEHDKILGRSSGNDDPQLPSPKES